MSPQTRLTLLSIIVALNVVSFALPAPDLTVDSEASSNEYHRQRRNVIIDKQFRWPDGVVPYKIDDNLSDNARREIRIAMQYIESKSCVTFREAAHNEYYTRIISKGQDCWSLVGYNGHNYGDYQELNLGKGCYHFRHIVHELLHTLGIHHQHSTPNRDEYVEIITANIKPDQEHNFVNKSYADYTDFGLPYDYNSIMHYAYNIFSTNGKPTIIAKNKEYQDIMGTAEKMSAFDVIKLNLMYTCKPNTLNGSLCPKGYTLFRGRCYRNLVLQYLTSILNKVNIHLQEYIKRKYLKSTNKS